MLDYLRRREILFQQFGLKARAGATARDDLFGIQNARKAYTGMIQGLQDPAFLAGKQKDEQELLAQDEQRSGTEKVCRGLEQDCRSAGPASRTVAAAGQFFRPALRYRSR